MANIFSEPSWKVYCWLFYISVALVLLVWDFLGNTLFCCKFYINLCTSHCPLIFPRPAPDKNSCFLHTDHLAPSLHSFYVTFRRTFWTSTFPGRHRHGIFRPLLRELFWISRGKGQYVEECTGFVDGVLCVHLHVLLEGECGTKWPAVRCSEIKLCKVHFSYFIK